MSVFGWHRGSVLFVAFLLWVQTGSRPALAQGTTTGGFAPGARTIVDLEFSGTAIGEFPQGLRLLHGNMEVVDRGGVRMLRASSPSEFVLQLPEVLPKDFTVEFEIIPKACCNPVDLMLEGVISGSRSPVSAQLEWDADHFAVVGGNREMFQMDMPASIAATLPSTLTKVAVSFEDETVKMYTNGRRLYTLSARKFMRGRVLRISLGGQDEDKYAVYLAKVRVADLAPAIITSNAPQGGPRGVTAAAPAPNAAAPGTPSPTLPTVGSQPTTSSSNPATATPMGVPAVMTGTATPMPASSSTSTSSPTRPPGTTGGTPTILSNGPAPTVTVTSVPGGLKVSYDLIAGTQNYGTCRESPPGSACVPYSIGNGSNVNGNTISQYDLGLAPGSTYAYRVTAFQTGGQYGQSAAASGAAGSLGAPANLRVTGVNAAPAEAILAWDPVSYRDEFGQKTVQSYQVSGTGLASPKVVSATQISIPLSAATGTNTWTVAPVLPNAVTGWQAYSAASLTYVSRYRIVAQAILVNHSTGDNALLFDGAQDEVYLATVTGLTNRALAAPVATVVKSQTYGDGAGFPQRFQAGSASPTGGLQTRDKLFRSLDTNAPAGTPSPGFPLLIWEGPMDDQAVVVTHSALWESDNNGREYGDWSNTVFNLVKSSFGNHAQTVQGIQQLITNADFGPIVPFVDRPSGAYPSSTRCTTQLTNGTAACADGEDRPLGLKPYFSTVFDFTHSFFVFTRAAIEKSLGKPLSQQPLAGTPGFVPGPGVIVIDFRDGTSVPPMGSGDYTLILRVERIP